MLIVIPEITPLKHIFVDVLLKVDVSFFHFNTSKAQLKNIKQKVKNRYIIEVFFVKIIEKPYQNSLVLILSHNCKYKKPADRKRIANLAKV